MTEEAQSSPVESSSGYSSPRGTESKSPTPEPFGDAGDAAQRQRRNVTVIQIDSQPTFHDSIKEVDETAESNDDTATYAVPRKR